MALRRLVVAALFLALSTICSTTRVVRLDTGQGQPIIHIPRTDAGVLLVSEKIKEALEHMRAIGTKFKEV